jgi:outer membrane lipoprotein-sorting protein
MACMTDEQLAQFALGVAEFDGAQQHLEQCQPCREQLATMQDLVQKLAMLSATADQNHSSQRERLLAAVSNPTARFVDPSSSRIPLAGIWASAHHRLAPVAILGSVILLAVVYFVVIPSSPRQLSAMEHVAEELNKIESYSYKVSSTNTFVDKQSQQPASIKESGSAYWRSPNGFRSETENVKTVGESAAAKPTQEILEHFVEAFPPNHECVFIDYKRRTYCHLPFEPIGSNVYPLDMLRMIREQQYQVTRDLGIKPIGNKPAHGYVVELKHPHDRESYPPIDVWIDPQTNLPVECGYVIHHKQSEERLRIDDFQWNLDLKAKLFSPSPPQDFLDITPPSDELAIAQITDALKLYAELSGGHYPQVKNFDGAAIRQEMLKMAGLSKGSPPASIEQRHISERIEQSTAGFDWITRILKNPYHAGYFGKTVGPNDKDKPLLWWTAWGPERCRVIFGDLHTKTLPPDQAAILGIGESVPFKDKANTTSEE